VHWSSAPVDSDAILNSIQSPLSNKKKKIRMNKDGKIKEKRHEQDF
jgi:hypothetical protein